MQASLAVAWMYITQQLDSPDSPRRFLCVECSVQGIIVVRITQCVRDNREDNMVLEQSGFITGTEEQVSHNYTCIQKSRTV